MGPHWRPHWLLLLVGIAIACASSAAQIPPGCRVGGTSLSPMCHWQQWFNAKRRMAMTVNAEAQAALAARAAKVAALGTSAPAWAARQAEVRQQFTAALGPIPAQRTPLNANVTGTAAHAGVTVDKVIFESRPRFFVTAAVFYSPAALQAAAEAGTSMPVVLYASGHEQFAFRSNNSASSAPQRLAWNLALKGFVVMAYDPPSQGERVMYWNASAGASSVGWGVPEHQYFGRQLLLNGVAPASMWIWDGMRALDYVLSRADLRVDAARVGMAGCSGGGTQTAYLSALDPRIAASSTACYMTTMRRLLQYIGPQDAEQVWMGGFARGLDLPDLAELRAPRPTQLLFTRDDQIFPITGSREAFAEASAAFVALAGRDHGGPASGGGNDTVRSSPSPSPSLSTDGSAAASGALETHEANYKHGYALPNRQALYAYFGRVLSNPASNATEVPVPALPTAQLFATRTGQVATSVPGALMAHDIVLQYAAQNGARLRAARADVAAFVAALPRLAVEVSGFRAPPSPPAAAPFFLGQVCDGPACPDMVGDGGHDGGGGGGGVAGVGGSGGARWTQAAGKPVAQEAMTYTTDKWVLEGEGECQVSVLWYRALQPAPAAVPATSGGAGAPAASALGASGAAGKSKMGAVVILSPEPARVNASSSVLLAAALGAGYDVVVPALCGLGEVGNGWSSGYGDGTMSMYVAMMLNRSVVGMQAADLHRVWALVRGGVPSGDEAAAAARGEAVTTHVGVGVGVGVGAGVAATVAYGPMGSVALHAGAAAVDAVSSAAAAAGAESRSSPPPPSPPPLALVQGPSSYMDVVSTRLYASQPFTEIPGVLRHYDLPDVAATQAPRPLLLLGPHHADAESTPLSAAETAAAYNFTARAYARAGAAPALSFDAGPRLTPAEADAAAFKWLQGL